MLYLIDIDGTLLLTGGAGNEALNRAFGELYGASQAMSVVQPAGKTDPQIAREAFVAAMGRPPSRTEVDTLLACYLRYLPDALARAQGFRWLAGVPSALDRLAAAGHALGLATGNLREAARLKLARGGLWQRFAFGGFGDDDADRPRLVAVAAERGCAWLGREVPPTEILVVGDTPRDVAAARANGFVAVAVASGTVPRADLMAAAPDRLIGGLDEL